MNTMDIGHTPAYEAYNMTLANVHEDRGHTHTNKGQHCKEIILTNGAQPCLLCARRTDIQL